MNGFLGMLLALLGGVLGPCATGVGYDSTDGGTDGGSATLCAAGPGTVKADVDGDGGTDLLDRGRAGGPLTVCFAGGGRYVLGSPRTEGPLTVNDADGDGDAEVWIGASVPGGVRFEVLRWDGEELVPLGITLRGGAPSGADLFYAAGCEPPDRLVEVEVHVRQRVGRATTFTVDEADVTRSVREVRVPSGADPVAYAKSLVRPCSYGVAD